MQTQPIPRSGQWAGFYNTGDEASARQHMDVMVRCDGERLSGVGQDGTGLFVVRGRYDSQNLECNGELTYSCGRRCRFQGYCDLEGMWGTWQGDGDARGGFRLRPLAAADPVEMPGGTVTLTGTLS